ncbi:MAG: flagellar basal body L-ring protein FlgH [Gammaproteobacteria bacterium]|nr:flagellar basal body L-ring protein FlgH [Gammaproteobacteria bacterium]
MRRLTLCLVFLAAGCATTRRPEDLYIPPDPPRPTLVQASDGSIYKMGADPALFEDLKPRQVGDILTVLLVENTNAQKSASTTSSKEDTIALENPTLFGREVSPSIGASVSAAREFEGTGGASQSNKISGSVTVTVVERLPNGNLVVRGEKRLELNQGEEFVRLSGIVRPADIGPDNSVLSSRVADARITYAGTGALADANRQGWLSRFFSSPWWPF